MTNTRTAIAALLAAAALVLTGCTDGSAPEIDVESEPTATAPAATSGAGESDEPEMPAAAAELIGMVGTGDDPEAYEIALLDGDGNPVTSLPAGDYSLTFVDESQLHNFHLTGDGVDVATDVQGTDASTVEITLVPGSYTFVCDPHEGTMRGELEVTG